MVKSEVRFPILVTETSEREAGALLNFHSMVSGKSPSATIQLTCVYWPSCRGLLSKTNGVILGGTGGKMKK